MTAEEEKELVRLLKIVEPGFLSYPIFKEMARINVMSIIEFVPLRIKNRSIELLLIQRSEHDDFWPNEFHTPGTVVRSTDIDNLPHSGFERIIEDELGGIKISSPHFVGNLTHRGKRGIEQAQVYFVEVLEDPKIGDFFRIDNLPENLMEQQQKFIDQSIKSFKKFKNLS